MASFTTRITIKLIIWVVVGVISIRLMRIVPVVFQREKLENREKNRIRVEMIFLVMQGDISYDEIGEKSNIPSRKLSHGSHQFRLTRFKKCALQSVHRECALCASA